MTLGTIIGVIGFIIGAVGLYFCGLAWREVHRVHKTYGNLADLELRVRQLKTTIDKQEQDIHAKSGELTSLINSTIDADKQLSVARSEINGIRILKDKEEENLEAIRQHAEKQREDVVALVAKEYDLEKERQKAERLKELRQALHNLDEAGELATMQQTISEAKATVDAIQQETARRRKPEDFLTKHSLEFSKTDSEDIDVIRGCASRLHNPSVLSNVLWTTFYQKPLQDLRVRLFTKVSNKVCGIYKIADKDDPTKCYIGQSKDISNRWTQHIKAALNGEPCKFYDGLRKAGPENFTFEVVEEISEANLNERERYWIDFYNAETFGYNTPGGAVCRSSKASN